MAIGVLQTAQEVGNVKRKNDEDREYEREVTKDVKKMRNSYEIEVQRVEQRVEDILKDYTRMCSDNKVDKGEWRSQHVVLGSWGDKRRSPSVVVSTTELEPERTKTCNKVVPPLRLKKVVREGISEDAFFLHNQYYVHYRFCECTIK